MFVHRPMASSPQPGLQSVPQTSSPTSQRPSRLRGLSYLRNYTHHRQSRDSSHHSSSGDRHHDGTEPLTRSASTSDVSSAPAPRTARSSRGANRLTLVNWASAPLNLANDPIPENPSSPQSRPSQQRRSHSSTNPITTSAGASIANNLTVSPTDAGPSETLTGASADALSRTMTATEVQTATADTTMVNGVAAAAQSDLPSPAGSNGPVDILPSIRFSAYYDPRSTRPSLTFPPISRTLPTGSETIRVGRYSERDSQTLANVPANQPSSAPVGFKSKVVSRRHCEFWYENGKWYIKDVKSSSGTFLNHIRLSPPSQESKAFAVNDGDIVQLGIDFKGGEEMIFRCVKMRLELNRGWQNKLNSFNMAAHQRLRTMGTAPASEPGSTSSSQDCSICLNLIAPCQSLFVAPCSHTWHFKCVKSLVMSPHYPIFICPNCRAGADLEADVEEAAEDWEQASPAKAGESTISATQSAAPLALPEAAVPEETSEPEAHDPDAMDVTVNVDSPQSPARENGVSHSTSEPVPIRNPASGLARVSEDRTPSPPANGVDTIITPRNNAGPWVFDGHAGQNGGATVPGGVSLDAAADAATTGGDSHSESSVQGR